jgi:hypothetical protein
MMSLNNAGGSISSLWGGALLNALHIVKIPKNETLAALPDVILTDDDMTFDFTNLMTVLWIRMALMIVPALLVFWMIPDTTTIKHDDIEMDGFVPLERESEDGESEGGFSDFEAFEVMDDARLIRKGE